MKAKGIRLTQKVRNRRSASGPWVEAYALPGTQRTTITLPDGRKRRYRGWASRIEESSDGLVDVTMDGLERLRGLRR